MCTNVKRIIRLTLVLSIIGLIAWFVCFCLGLCTWVGGLVLLLVILLSLFIHSICESILFSVLITPPLAGKGVQKKICIEQESKRKFNEIHKLLETERNKVEADFNIERKRYERELNEMRSLIESERNKVEANFNTERKRYERELNEMCSLLETERNKVEADFNTERKRYERELNEMRNLLEVERNKVETIKCLVGLDNELLNSIFHSTPDYIVSNNKNELFDIAYSSIFAPAEIRRKSHMLVQVYIHSYEYTEDVKTLAKESQENAERRDYIPLQCKLKKDDKIDIVLSIYGNKLLTSIKKSIVWQGLFTKCSFDYFVPNNINIDELSCVAILAVNETPVGELRFITKIVEMPKQLSTKIIAHKYRKVFISYSHKDGDKVQSFHEGLKLAGIEHFFDRTSLNINDIFPLVIQDYINSADLFVLFWSKNAAESKYVSLEIEQALKRAYPQVKPRETAKLSIYPMLITPHEELPIEIKDYYHYGIIE